MILVSLALAAPHASYPKLVSANGYGAVVWDGDRLVDFYPHLYQEYSAGVVTPDVLFDSYFGVVDADGGRWLLDWDDVAYVPGTGVFCATGGVEGVYAAEWCVVAPMTAGSPSLAQTFTLTNLTAGVRDLQVVSLQNWHVGGEEDTWSPRADRVEERGSDVQIYMDAPAATDAMCAGVYDAVEAGVRIGGGCDLTGEDVVPGFGWSYSLAPSESVIVGVYASTAETDSWAGTDVTAWLPREVADWEAWHTADTVATEDETEATLAAQSLAFLRMAQVREAGDAYGQIPASLPLAAPVGDFQHIWNITWVRDGSYAAAALAAAGHPAEAADLLRFLVQEGKTGEYRSYVGGADYVLSVCRVYGDGSEWSDADENGPNVEFDNFGLYLWAFEEVAASGLDLGDELGLRVLDGVADVLVGLVDPNTGLLGPDSSIWERHWNGHQEQFTYSSVWAQRGLDAAAVLADRLGDPRAETYRTTAASIRVAIAVHLVDTNGVLAASREQLDRGSDYADLAAIEAFDQGVFSWRSEEFAASMAAWDRDLGLASGGYRRNDDGSTYDDHEWAVIDLRVAEALARSGDRAGADLLEDLVTEQAALNHFIVPELYHPDTADYAGPAPMLGFGAGAWVWYVNHREADPDPVCDTCVDDTGDDPKVAGPDCGCTSGGAGAMWAVCLVIPFLLPRAGEGGAQRRKRVEIVPLSRGESTETSP